MIIQNSSTPFSEIPEELRGAVTALSQSSEKDRGSVQTRRDVVEFILDLVGYNSSADLTNARLLEPSCGSGEFVLEAAKRLIKSYYQSGGAPLEASSRLSDAIWAVELSADSYEITKSRLLKLLIHKRVPSDDAVRLVDNWLHQNDFLLTDLTPAFTHIVGNPPYVRQELIPGQLLQEYRNRFSTIYDRADLYVAFIEKSLSLLEPRGVLGFICSDRWIKNKYGGPLRAMVGNNFHLRYYVDMVGTDPFSSNVSAYPAVFVIARDKGESTLVAHPLKASGLSLNKLAHSLKDKSVTIGIHVRESNKVFNGSQPWLLNAATEVDVLRKLEGIYPSLEEAGCKVGIGVATGADRIYIRPDDLLPVEKSRKLPLVMASDVKSGRIEWAGNYVLNPFEDDGSLADLRRYPRFAAYVRSNEEKIRGRYVARRQPKSWYKTIDRISPQLTHRPKLLIHDIKGSANASYDSGNYYPHHNLYYVVSDEWDLKALQAVLRSSISSFFIGMYSIRMRGGYLRFQAQYLRRIVIPDWNSVSKKIRSRLANVTEDKDAHWVDENVFDLYGLSERERKTVQEFSARLSR